MILGNYGKKHTVAGSMFGGTNVDEPGAFTLPNIRKCIFSDRTPDKWHNTSFKLKSSVALVLRYVWEPSAEPATIRINVAIMIWFRAFHNQQWLPNHVFLERVPMVSYNKGDVFGVSRIWQHKRLPWANAMKFTTKFWTSEPSCGFFVAKIRGRLFSPLPPNGLWAWAKRDLSNQIAGTR